MIRLNETEEIIRLIYNGFDIELLSFELDIPIEKLQEYKKRLELRQFAKESIKNGKITEALEELNVQIPKRKSSNIRKKEKQNIKEPITEEEQYENEVHEEYVKPDYEETINRYKTEIIANPQKAQEKRNLLAFAYFMSGKIDKAREELIALAEETSSYMAYRQLVHIEKKIGNLEDAKLWAYEALDKFPNSIEIREQLISIAKEERDEQEVIKQLRDITEINPKNEKNKNRLKTIIDREER